MGQLGPERVEGPEVLVDGRSQVPLESTAPPGVRFF